MQMQQRSNKKMAVWLERQRLLSIVYVFFLLESTLTRLSMHTKVLHYCAILICITLILLELSLC